VNKSVRRIYVEQMNARKRVKVIYRLFLGEKADTRLGKMVFFLTVATSNEHHRDLVKDLISVY